ncbi:MAG: hypothetical protein HY916_04210 [Desulfovibrio sp.]|nr:hypothetical protein [Desulfovibrio sp.]
MSWLNGPWRQVARLTHLPAVSQRRLWRGLILGWMLLLAAGWAVLSVLTRAEEKAVEEAGQTYVTVAPLAAEVMDYRQRRGLLESQPPLTAAEQVARSAGIGPERLRIQLSQGDAGGTNAQTLTLRAQALTLRELVDVLRGLKAEAGLTTISAHMAPAQGKGDRMDLDMVLSR